jgi:hypothetical protein
LLLQQQLLLLDPQPQTWLLLGRQQPAALWGLPLLLLWRCWVRLC